MSREAPQDLALLCRQLHYKDMQKIKEFLLRPHVDSVSYFSRKLLYDEMVRKLNSYLSVRFPPYP